MTQVAMDGQIIGDFRIRGRAIDLVVVAEGRGSRAPEDLGGIPLAANTASGRGVATANGAIVPLASVTNFVETAAAQQVNRLERLPSVLLSLQLPRGLTVEEAQRTLESAVLAPLREQGAIFPELNVIPQGSADKLDSFMAQFFPWPPSITNPGVFLMAGIITYLLLAALFESFLHPLVIIMSVPFALVGGFAGLWVLHKLNPESLLDVLTMLGFVILIGTIVNNPILIVHQALNYMKEGMDRQHAIALSTQTRVRPIFMSVVTSVAGMAPLVAFGGAGSELYRGLGAVVVGGLLLSTVFTLLLTPTLMSLLMDLQAFLKRLMGLDHQPPRPPRKVVPTENPEPATVA